MAKAAAKGGLKGGPGDQNDEPEDDEPEEEIPPQEETDAEKAERLRKEEVEGLKTQLAELTNELRTVRAQKPEKVDDEKAKKPKDWAEAFYKDPNKAIADLRKEIHEEITGQLRSEYQGAQGEQQFWSAFYSEHPDLKEDDDLVKLTLQNNRATLGNLPVEKAAAKLADLTRDRILRYGGKDTREADRKRPFTEGGGGGKPPKREEPEEEKVVTLSSVLRDRAKKRRAGGKATAA